MDQRESQRRIFIGFIILAAGLALLLSNFGILDYRFEKYLRRWELVPVLIGLILLFKHENKGPGIIMIIIGGVLYAKHTFDLHFNFWELFWPGILVLVGILLIFRKKFEPPHCEKKNLENSDDIIDEVAVFGGGDRTIVSQNFMGGKILAIFGGSNFNMARAKLAPGKNYIDVLAVFGGMKFIVPEDWKITISAVSIFGGFSDKHRIRPIENKTPENELIIKGFVIFGGGEIKSY